MRKLARVAIAPPSVALVVGVALLAPPREARPDSPGVVISQVYGGGGNAGAILKNDFIELFNRGVVPVDVTGWTVQYAAATSTNWQETSLAGVIQPGHYYLVQEAQGAAGTDDLPTPDAIGTTQMGSTAGKVALVNDAVPLTGSGCPFEATVVDFVGYGDTPDCYEGSNAPAPNNFNSVQRGSGGCIDRDNNLVDFILGVPNPRNAAATPNECNPVPTGPSTWGRVKTLYR